MPNGSVDHLVLLIEDLKDPEEALGYLNVLLEEYSDDDEISKKILLGGLGYILQAQISLQTKKQANYSRYKFTFEGKELRLSNFMNILNVPKFEVLLENLDQNSQSILEEPIESTLHPVIRQAEHQEMRLSSQAI